MWVEEEKNGLFRDGERIKWSSEFFVQNPSQKTYDPFLPIRAVM